MASNPRPHADRRTLIRRVYLDLVGVPPTPEEVQAFVEDSDARRLQKLVDRLLADTRYGERWARHWLDLARFAESDGFAIDGERPTAWRYRDYVIRSFNQDKPYDQFVKEQLAGDEMGGKSTGAGRSERASGRARLPAHGNLGGRREFQNTTPSGCLERNHRHDQARSSSGSRSAAPAATITNTIPSRSAISIACRPSSPPCKSTTGRLRFWIPRIRSR